MQHSFALATVACPTPTELLRRATTAARAQAQSAAASSPMPLLSQQSCSSQDALPPMSQQSSSSSGDWTEVEFAQTHIRGSVKLICGGKVRMEISIPDEDDQPIIKEVGPLKTADELQHAIAEFKRVLISYNKNFECYTNGYGFQLADHRQTVRMFLDADFSQNKSKSAMIDASDLDYVMERHWGCKKLKADGNWYAYSQNPDGTVVWLHDYILNRQGRRLVDFISNNTKDCRAANMRTTKLVPFFYAPENLIHVEVKPSSKASSGVALLCYEQSGKRWKFNWKVGNNMVSKFFYNSQYEKNADLAKEAAMAFREATLQQGKQQMEDNCAFLEAWVNQPTIAAEISPPASKSWMIKNTFPLAKSANGMTVGPWLRGVVQQHGQGLWCAKINSKIFGHFSTEEEALKGLHQLNVSANCSINSYGVNEKDGVRFRCILLEECPSHMFQGGANGCILAISDDPKIAAALSEHVWKVHTVDMDSEKATNWEAVNADPQSPWQKAQDLVTFIKLQDLKNTKNEPIISKQEDFFRIVSIKKRTKMWDCRNGSIECALIDQEAVHEKEKRKAERSKALGKNHEHDRIECVDSLGFMKLGKWTSQANPDEDSQPKHSPMALAAIEAITSGAALIEGFEAPASAAASSSSAAPAAASSMGDD